MAGSKLYGDAGPKAGPQNFQAPTAPEDHNRLFRFELGSGGGMDAEKVEAQKLAKECGDKLRFVLQPHLRHVTGKGELSLHGSPELEQSWQAIDRELLGKTNVKELKRLLGALDTCMELGSEIRRLEDGTQFSNINAQKALQAATEPHSRKWEKFGLLIGPGLFDVWRARKGWKDKDPGMVVDAYVNTEKTGAATHDELVDIFMLQKAGLDNPVRFLGEANRVNKIAGKKVDAYHQGVQALEEQGAKYHAAIGQIGASLVSVQEFQGQMLEAAMGEITTSLEGEMTGYDADIAKVQMERMKVALEAAGGSQDLRRKVAEGGAQREQMLKMAIARDVVSIVVQSPQAETSASRYQQLLSQLRIHVLFNGNFKNHHDAAALAYRALVYIKESTEKITDAKGNSVHPWALNEQGSDLDRLLLLCYEAAHRGRTSTDYGNDSMKQQIDQTIAGFANQEKVIAVPMVHETPAQSASKPSPAPKLPLPGVTMDFSGGVVEETKKEKGPDEEELTEKFIDQWQKFTNNLEDWEWIIDQGGSGAEEFYKLTDIVQQCQGWLRDAANFERQIKAMDPSVADKYKDVLLSLYNAAVANYGEGSSEAGAIWTVAMAGKIKLNPKVKKIDSGSTKSSQVDGYVGTPPSPPPPPPHPPLPGTPKAIAIEAEKNKEQAISDLTRETVTEIEYIKSTHLLRNTREGSVGRVLIFHRFIDCMRRCEDLGIDRDDVVAAVTKKLLNTSVSGSLIAFSKLPEPATAVKPEILLDPDRERALNLLRSIGMEIEARQKLAFTLSSETSSLSTTTIPKEDVDELWLDARDRMYCGRCGSRRERGLRFCRHCRNDFSNTEDLTEVTLEDKTQEEKKATCRRCGTLNLSGAVFCDNCGGKLKQSIEAKEDQGELDERFDEAVGVVAGAGYASSSLLQRELEIGYGRADSILKQMEREGVVVGPDIPGGNRRVIYNHKRIRPKGLTLMDSVKINKKEIFTPYRDDPQTTEVQTEQKKQSGVGSLIAKTRNRFVRPIRNAVVDLMETSNDIQKYPVWLRTMRAAIGPSFVKYTLPDLIAELQAVDTREQLDEWHKEYERVMPDRIRQIQEAAGEIRKDLTGNTTPLQSTAIHLDQIHVGMAVNDYFRDRSEDSLVRAESGLKDLLNTLNQIMAAQD